MAPLDSAVDWQDASRTVVRGLLGALQDDPDAGRLMLVEALAGGGRVRAERERMLALFEVRAHEFLDAAPRDGKALDLPPEMLLGAVRSIVSQQLRTHSEDRMRLLVDDVMGWIESYAVPAGQARWSTGPHTLLPARVGKQWLAAAPPALVLQRLPRGRHKLPQAAVERSQRTRIIHGTSEVVVAKGYAAVTVADIVSAAGISRDVFYSHFANKYEAYLAAQEYGTANLFEACAAAYFAGQSWPERVWLALQVLVLAMAGNPALTHLRVVECYAAGTAAIEQTDELKRVAVIFLQEGFTVTRGGGAAAAAGRSRDHRRGLRKLLRARLRRRALRAAVPAAAADLPRDRTVYRTAEGDRRGGAPQRAGDKSGLCLIRRRRPRGWPGGPVALALSLIVGGLTSDATHTIVFCAWGLCPVRWCRQGRRKSERNGAGGGICWAGGRAVDPAGIC